MPNFFDFREQQAEQKKQARAPQPGDPSAAISVSQLTRIIEQAIKSGVPSKVVVRGELSNVNVHRASGHIYFTLKDADACIDGVMWKSDAERLKFEPADGQEVLATGAVQVYAVRGRYQLYARSIEPLGKGALEIAFRKLYAKLETEGLFDPSRKRELPRYPMHIALVTSRNAAALQDMLKVLRRFPWLKLSLHDVPVQGDGAAEKIAEMIRNVGRGSAKSGAQVIILARGGGSLEDLWEFNEEIVARAIAASAIPVITGIGHEVDTSIADMVADFHAHTPTEAAQIVTANWRTARDELASQSLRLMRAIRNLSENARQRLALVERHEMFRRPLDGINQFRQRVDDGQRNLAELLRQRLHGLHRSLEARDGRLRSQHPIHRVRMLKQNLAASGGRLLVSMKSTVQRRSMTLGAIEGKLGALSPNAVLGRGYSITTIKRGGAVIRSIGAAKPGETIVTRVVDGEIESVVEDQKQQKLFK